MKIELFHPYLGGTIDHAVLRQDPLCPPNINSLLEITDMLESVVCLVPFGENKHWFFASIYVGPDGQRFSTSGASLSPATAFAKCVGEAMEVHAQYHSTVAPAAYEAGLCSESDFAGFLADDPDLHADIDWVEARSISDGRRTIAPANRCRRIPGQTAPVPLSAGCAAGPTASHAIKAARFEAIEWFVRHHFEHGRIEPSKVIDGPVRQLMFEAEAPVWILIDKDAGVFGSGCAATSEEARLAAEAELKTTALGDLVMQEMGGAGFQMPEHLRADITTCEKRAKIPVAPSMHLVELAVFHSDIHVVQAIVPGISVLSDSI